MIIRHSSPVISDIQNADRVNDIHLIKPYFWQEYDFCALEQSTEYDGGFAASSQTIK